MAQSDVLSIINAAKVASLSDYVATIKEVGFGTVDSLYDQGEGFERLARGQDTVKVLTMKHQRSITFSLASRSDCERVLASVLPNRRRDRAYDTVYMRKINWVGRYGWPRRSFVYVRPNEGCPCQVYLMPRGWMDDPLPPN